MTTTAEIDRDVVRVEGSDGENTVALKDDSASGEEPKDSPRERRWARTFAYIVLPAIALLLAVGAGYLKYLVAIQRVEQSASAESARAATDAAIAMLSYRPDTVQNDLGAAKDDLTGSFRNSYSELVDDVVAPAAIQKMITAVATVPAAASVSATESHAVVLLFVNQTITIGNGAPSSTNSSVRATLDKVDGRWLVSAFEPI